MSIQAVYTAHATASGDGRNGHVRSSDGFVDTDVATPQEMGGAGGATNPEQLFAAGFAACYHSALKLVARHAKTELDPDTAIEAQVGIGPDGSGGYGLVVALTAHLPGLSRSDADELVNRAHQVCPYSNAVRGNVDVTVTTAV